MTEEELEQAMLEAAIRLSLEEHALAQPSAVPQPAVTPAPAPIPRRKSAVYNPFLFNDDDSSSAMGPVVTLHNPFAHSGISDADDDENSLLEAMRLSRELSHGTLDLQDESSGEELIRRPRPETGV